MKRTFNIPVFIFLYFALQGCSTIPLVSMYKLSQLDPLSADPQQIRIAVRTSKVFSVQKGDVRMQLGYQADDNSLIIDDLYLVEVIHGGFLHKELLNDLQDNEAVTILHLSNSDAKQMYKTQQLIAERNASGLKGKGSFGVSIDSSCLSSALPSDELLVDILIQTDPQESFYTVSEDLDLLAQDGAVDSIKQWPICSDAE
jgi:hypothetical protein